MTRVDSEVTTEAPPGAERARPKGLRELAASTVGAAVESFDWTIYAVLAPYFASQMFAGDNEAIKLIAAYAGFAVSFLMRPLGGYVLGRIADSRGRRFALLLSMVTISAGSLLIAILPTAASIGVGAPLLLLLMRALQGLALGGENPSVAAYITETAPPRHRFLFCGLSYAGVIVGNILCFAVAGTLLLFLGKEGVSAGGWRIGFVVAAAFGLLAYWVRSIAAESEEFEQVREESARPEMPGLRRILVEHGRNMTAVFLMTTGTTIGYYFGTTYLPKYAEQVGVSQSASTALNMIPSLLVMIGAMAVFGVIADRFGAMVTFRAGFVLLAVVTVPLMSALAQGWLPVWVVTVVYLAVGVAPTIALANVLFARPFPVAVRVVCMGVPFSVGVAMFGGTFPLMAQSLQAAGLLSAVPWVAASAAVVSLIGTYVLKPDPA